ncbi:hypothetical protein KL953_17630 [Mycolicibacterium goodii]|uniref:hypothetical protein n=1 Tax=Mycolicibacterium goodii TaxID=134601 RepID=UPI001BDD3178|nr:hypothetical protein [Mycolicibacterium goodii]MBU8810706.1 hypothetical protein [Mycolicibacterium goodii]
MINDDDHDMRDPLRAAFTDYRRAPRDVVARTAEHSLDDLHHMADGASQVTVTHYELGEHGITRHTEQVTITAPIIHARKEDR